MSYEFIEENAGWGPRVSAPLVASRRSFLRRAALLRDHEAAEGGCPTAETAGPGHPLGGAQARGDFAGNTVADP
jgi:hypothetical protein